ncbi:MAG: hypothetical protein RJA49_3136 [Actinomycetota bacterium]
MTGKAIQAAKPAAIKQRASSFAKKLKTEYEAGLRDDPTPAEREATADEVSEAMRKVDWAKVKAATAGKTADATQSVKAMAAQVDWDKVTPVAAEVSSALIAAVAAGQLPIGGVMGARVARTIMNDRGLAQQVARSLARTPKQAPPDFRPLIAGAIETTARET